MPGLVLSGRMHSTIKSSICVFFFPVRSRYFSPLRQMGEQDSLSDRTEESRTTTVEESSWIFVMERDLARDDSHFREAESLKC